MQLRYQLPENEDDRWHYHMVKKIFSNIFSHFDAILNIPLHWMHCSMLQCIAVLPGSAHF